MLYKVYDVNETYDSLWGHEIINELFDAGFTTDKLNLLFLESSNRQIVVKSPSGMSWRITIHNTGVSLGRAVLNSDDG